MAASVLDHPLADCLLTRLREASTPPAEFRHWLQQLTSFLLLQATKDLSLLRKEIQTPMGPCPGAEPACRIAIVPILRAGLGMVEPMAQLLPQAEIRHLGFYRDEDSLEAVPYYCRLAGPAPQLALVADPMLATGGTAIAAIQTLWDWGVEQVHFLGILGAPEGVAALEQAHPQVDIHLAALDKRLNQVGFIVPGLGDAGDRQMNTP